MRRWLAVLAALGTTAVLAPAGAAAAAAPVLAARSGPTCYGGVTGVDSTRHVRSEEFHNEKLVHSAVGRKLLGFDVTGWGLFNSTGTERHSTLRLDTVSSDGQVRRVSLDRTEKSVKVTRVIDYRQRDFAPRLFADGYTYFVYTVDGGTLHRWSLTRKRNGTVHLTKRVRLARGMDDLTSLQASSVEKVHGVASELLYATTTTGELLQFVVPLAHPTAMRVHRLLRSGLDGVTELAWSICDGDRTYHSFIAIDPTDNRATWLTIKDAASRPRATLRAAVTGESDWSFTAVY